MLWGCLLAPASAQRGSTASPTAEPARWQEAAYGISLVPPAETAQWEGPSVLWASPRGYTISFELATSETPFNLEQAATSSVVQMGFAHSFPRLVPDASGQPAKPRPERIAERPGIRMYFDITEDDGRQWLYGQAIVMLEPHAAAVLKLNAPQAVIDEGKAAFERVIESLRVPLATELDEMRGRLIEAGEAWLRTLTHEDLRAALPDLQLYRLIQQGRDVGYLQLRSVTEPEALKRAGYEPDGVLVQTVQREYLDTQMIDTQMVAFDSADGQREVFDHKSTVRPSDRVGGAVAADARQRGLPSRDRPGGEPMTWSRTGVRGEQRLFDRWVNAITVVSEAPPATDAARQIERHERFLGMRGENDLKGLPTERQWQAPDKAYLSQAMLPVLPAMLPAVDADYAFTAYHSPTGKPTLRTVSVVVQPDGGKLVIDRPTPRSSPLRHEFDATGRHLRSVFANGLVVQPATPEELRAVWETQ